MNEIINFGWQIYLTGFGVAFVAGFIDAVSGGGGLLTLPFLLYTGMSPVAALGTNKFQSSFGTLTAVINYTRSGTIHKPEMLTGIIATFIGAATGTLFVQMIDSDFMLAVIPFLLFAILLYFVFRRKYQPSDPKIPLRIYYIVFGFLLGFYDGFFGPGTGAFWTASLTAFAGFGITSAVSNTKVFNYVSNIVSFAIFAVGGAVYYDLGIVMALGQTVGGLAGSQTAIKKGVGFIRPLFLAVVSIMIINLIYRYWFT